jgi:3-oxoacyl-[acyl-carrier protein] reductase
VGHRVDGRVALITGVTRRVGIGAAIARELGDNGARLFLSFYRPYDRTQPWGVESDEPAQTAAKLRAGGIEVEVLEIDLATPASAETLVSAVIARFGTIDILVNNAAHSESGGIAALDAAQLDRHYAVNLRAPALLCAEFARRRAAGPGGRIVNITSGQGHGPMPSELAYAATKGGIDALTLSLSADLASRGITVNAIDPGATDTGWMDDALRESLQRSAPMGRVGLPQDAARLVGFLASDDAAWITGQIIRSRGGL